MTLRLGDLSVDAGLRDPQVIEQVENQAKYQGYIERQRDEVGKNLANEETCFPDDFDFCSITRPVQGSSAEARSASASDPGPGFPHSGRDPGSHLDPAGAFETRTAESQRQRIAGLGS
jgi:hypothetical protein